MYRVYDNKEKKWIKDFYLMPNGDMFTIAKSLFKNKLSLMSEQRYTLQKDIGAYDKYGNLIFEGDICRSSTDQDIVCVVAYYPPRAAYLLFEEKHSSYYEFNSYTLSEMEIVGNVFDNYNLIEFNEAE